MFQWFSVTKTAYYCCRDLFERMKNDFGFV